MKEALNILDPGVLKRSFLFASLPEEVIDVAWKSGNLRKFPAGLQVDLRTKGVEFLNFILEGEVVVEREFKAGKKEARPMGLGSVFGSVDDVLGVGKFCHGVFMAETKLFTLHRDAFRRLMEEYPDFHRQLSQVKAAISVEFESGGVPTVSSLEEEMPNEMSESLEDRGEATTIDSAEASTSIAGKTERTTSEDDLLADIAEHSKIEEPELQKDPKLKAEEFQAIFPNGDKYLISKMKKSELLLQGNCIFAEGDEIHFIIRDGSGSFDPFEIRATVEKKSEESFQLRLALMSKRLIGKWENALALYLSRNANRIFHPKLSEMENPLPVHLLSGNENLMGKAVALGSEGGIIQCGNPIRKRQVLVILRLESPNGRSSELRLPGEISGKKKDRYLVRFSEIQEDQKTLIDLFLSKPLDFQSSLPQTDPSKDKVEKLEVKRFFRFPAELVKFFMSELSEEVVLFRSLPGAKVGQAVRVRISIQKESFPVPKSHGDFLLEGQVQKTSKDGVRVTLLPSARPAIGDIRTIVDQVSVRRMERDVHRAVHTEHNVKNRRHMQFVLLILLLGASLVWVFYKVFL